MIGAEIEFINQDYAHHVNQLRETYKKTAEYVVGSLHHVNSIPIDFSPELYAKALSEAGNGQLKELYVRYFDEQYVMLQSIKPEVVGHFDLVRIFADQSIADSTLLDPEVWERVVRNIEYVVGYGGLFEINSRAWKKGLRDAYPQRDIIQVRKGPYCSVIMLKKLGTLITFCTNRLSMKRRVNLHYRMIVMDPMMLDYFMKNYLLIYQKTVSRQSII